MNTITASDALNIAHDAWVALQNAKKARENAARMGFHTHTYEVAEASLKVAHERAQKVATALSAQEFWRASNQTEGAPTPQICEVLAA